MSEAAYHAALESGFTTRARCWRVTRRDGAVLGFTDHDRDLAFGGQLYAAASALSPSEATATLGLSADEQEAVGALSSAAITEADIRAGRYDGAEAMVFDVDWTAPENHTVIGVYRIGEVSRDAAGFRAELVSRTADLTKRAGRRFLPVCDAVLGDARCQVALASALFTGAGTVTAATGFELAVSGLTGFADGWFSRGKLAWETGANAGLLSEVRAHRGGMVAIWRLPPEAITAGDTFTVSAGCNKSWAMCREKFANGANFRGFPQMPGEQFPAEYAVPGDPALDGGSRFAG